MLANQFIDRLERLGLLDQEIIAALRQQLAEGGSRVTPEAVAKLLVDNGQLTHFQATKLIGELRSGEYVEPADESGDDLHLAVEEAAEVSVDVAPVEAEPVVAVTAVEEVAAVEADSVLNEGPPPDRPKPTRKKPNAEKSVWDSFKIYGYLGIIALLLLVGGGIFWVLTRENADEVIGRADTLYDQQNYEAAQQAYLDFAEDFPDSQHASKANVRVVMTELYKAAEFKQEPWRAVDLAREKLPAIAEEPGMNDDRGNLGQLLVDVAANVANAAGKAAQTEQKQSLLSKLDEQFALMENPLYMTSTMRKNLANQIQSVEEDRKRVQREIDRNVQLNQSEAQMKELLGENKTKAAYDVRKELLRDFPDLEDNERLVTLIRQASDIQQTLVRPSDKLPETLTEPRPSKSLSTIVLTTLVGRPAPDMIGETLYLRAGGSILAFDGETGKLKWRNFVGYAKDLPPIRLAGEDGVLLSDSAELEVIRCRSDDGQVEWRAQIGEPFNQPVSEADDIFVATDAGRLILIDAISGAAKWAVQVPQKLQTGPGFDRRAQRAYLPGDHSNLYLLDARDGSCLESYYVGHAEGTIVVPPVPLMGHLFVIENTGSGLLQRSCAESR